SPMLASRAAVVSTLVVLVVVAGCLGAPSKRTGSDPINTTDGGPNATLPNGLGESAGLLETNRTENGTFGKAHTHDYWAGRESVVLFQGDVQVGNMIPLASNALVYEGTDK